ncbi:uncharacterized protein LOC144471089 [Augochlora pura]
MGVQNFGATLLFAACGLLQCSGQDLEYSIRTVIYGEPCLRDRNCIANAYCRVQKVCACDTSYSPTADRSMCIASEGTLCNNDTECSTMANAKCRQGKCACQDTFLLDMGNSSNCISRPTAEGDHCQREDDCQDSLGKAMCLDGRCKCISSYHFNHSTRQCIQSRGLYYPCNNSNQCAIVDNKVLECRNGQCVCAQGQPGCNKASRQAVLGIPLVILSFLYRFI